jgi:hypothetical protein
MRKEICILLLVFYVIRGEGAFVPSSSGLSCPCTKGPFLSVGFHLWYSEQLCSVDFVFGHSGQNFGIRVSFFFSMGELFFSGF